MADTRSLWPALAVLAAAVGVFHGYMKPGLDERQIGELEEYVQRAGQWEGRYPEDFELELMSGESLRLADQVGQRVLVLNFFASWCLPCREEMPELDRFAQRTDQEVLLVGIDVGEDRETVEKFLEEVPVSFPVVLDSHREVTSDYGATTLPTTVLVGLDGRIALYQTGAISNAEVTLDAALARQRTLRAEGRTITKEGYLAALAAQPGLPGADDEVELTGRALEIARSMPCPCGCEQQVRQCGCQTADKVMARLRETELEGKTDREIMEALNKEFCMGAAS